MLTECKHTNCNYDPTWFLENGKFLEENLLYLGLFHRDMRPMMVLGKDKATSQGPRF